MIVDKKGSMYFLTLKNVTCLIKREVLKYIYMCVYHFNKFYF